jgi:hypothetical protein
MECGIAGSCPDTYVCSYGFRPQVHVQYEHMFPRTTQHPPTLSRARNAFSLARSFLLLEDDYGVDWEVDRDEPGRGDRSGIDGISNRPARGQGAGAKPRTAEPHPHRTALRSGRSARVRVGQPAPAAQVCVCPVGGGNSNVSIPALLQLTGSTSSRTVMASTTTGRPWATRMSRKACMQG